MPIGEKRKKELLESLDKALKEEKMDKETYYYMVNVIKNKPLIEEQMNPKVLKKLRKVFTDEEIENLIEEIKEM